MHYLSSSISIDTRKMLEILYQLSQTLGIEQISHADRLPRTSPTLSGFVYLVPCTSVSEFLKRKATLFIVE